MRVTTLFASGLVSLVWLACGSGPTTPTSSGGSLGNGGSAAGGRTGSTGAGGSTVVVDASSLNASRQTCVDRVNELRATLGLPALQRWAANEACADGQAQSDSQTGTAHGAFDACPNMAQNECPGWASIASTLTDCIDQMWAEGPGTPYSAHGHYINMTNTSYTQISCGFYVTSSGKVWMVQDFK